MKHVHIYHAYQTSKPYCTIFNRTTKKNALAQKDRKRQQANRREEGLLTDNNKTRCSVSCPETEQQHRPSLKTGVLDGRDAEGEREGAEEGGGGGLKGGNSTTSSLGRANSRAERRTGTEGCKERV